MLDTYPGKFHHVDIFWSKFEWIQVMLLFVSNPCCPIRD